MYQVFFTRKENPNKAETTNVNEQARWFIVPSNSNYKIQTSTIAFDLQDLLDPYRIPTEGSAQQRPPEPCTAFRRCSCSPWGTPTGPAPVSGIRTTDSAGSF